MVDHENDAVRMVESPAKETKFSNSSRGSEMMDITPKRSHKIACNDEFYDMIEGVKCSIPRKWETTLKSEGII